MLADGIGIAFGAGLAALLLRIGAYPHAMNADLPYHDSIQRDRFEELSN